MVDKGMYTKWYKKRIGFHNKSPYSNFIIRHIDFTSD